MNQIKGLIVDEIRKCQLQYDLLFEGIKRIKEKIDQESEEKERIKKKLWLLGIMGNILEMITDILKKLDKSNDTKAVAKIHCKSTITSIFK